MTGVRLAIFDMDDVLCVYDRDARIEALARLSGRTPDQILRAIWHSGFEGLSDAGRLDATTYLAGFGKRLGYPITRDEWVAIRKLSMRPSPDVLALVEEVKTRAEVALLTNNGFLVAEEMARLFPEVPPLFGDHVFASAMFGTKKPDPAIYRALTARLGVPPEQAFFTDDKPRNVHGAEAAGLTGHIFRGITGLRAALAGLGLLGEEGRPLPILAAER